MPLFTDFSIRMIDVSAAQDNPLTAYRPTLDKVKAAGIRGIIVRVGYGRVIDTAFRWFWNEAKGKFERKPYWYGDYYSHRGTSQTDEQWGEEQADVCTDALKDDPADMPTAWDAEKSKYGGDLTEAVKPSYNRILRAFRRRHIARTGKDIELYTSPSLLWFFEDDMKDMDLYLAWWGSNVTMQMIDDLLASVGWRGKVTVLQITSSGDINNDGIADGLTLGMESAGLDLDVFPGTEAEYEAYCSGNVVTAPIETTPLPPLFQAKCISPAGSLTTRNAPNINGTDLNDDLIFGEIVTVYAIDPTTKWYRIDPLIQRWCSGSATYMQKIEAAPPVVEPPIEEPPAPPPAVEFTQDDKTHLEIVYAWWKSEHKPTQTPV